MSKAVRTTLSVVISLMFLSTLMFAGASASKADKDKNQEHHSKLSKAAFWRHHKDSDKKAKQTAATQSASKPAQTHAAQVKRASAKQSSTKVSNKQAPATVVAKKGQKAEQKGQKTTKGSEKKSAASGKAKTQKKAEPKVVSMQQ